MKTTITHNADTYVIDLAAPIDISIPIRHGANGVNAWYLDPAAIVPHEEGAFVGKISEGASTNFNDIRFNPHSHGTHTECLGHITEEFYSINQALNRFFFMAEVITVTPKKKENDLVISKKQLHVALGDKKRDAVVIRTLPNLDTKRGIDHSNTNPPYLLEEAAQFLKDSAIEHLLIDLPSVDKEKDNGLLLAHRAFWGMNVRPRHAATITELIFVPNTVIDGTYFLNLQVAPFENDASPSRPVLYKIMTNG
ncbi:MAG: cyclase family protein [Bacteroidota bacterium]